MQGSAEPNECVNHQELQPDTGSLSVLSAHVRQAGLFI